LRDFGPRSPLIIPIFIPNQGCPHRCVFCRQETIASEGPLGNRDVEKMLQESVRSPGFDPLRRTEVAFYGGTFTGLPEERMARLLQAVRPYIESGTIGSIRVSTRPDFIHEKNLEFLKRWGVSTVEIGAQSMDNRVLDLSRRGHSAEDTFKAVRLLKKYGFRVGIQLMPGLPGDSRSLFLRTIDAVRDLQPDIARLYPTLVVRGTELEDRYLAGRYRPLSLDEALWQCEEGCVRLEGGGIPVIRMGVLNAPSLAEKGEIIAGPWHASFGYLVRCRIYWRRLEPTLPPHGETQRIRLRVPRRELPLIRGYKNTGVRMIEDRTGAKVTEIRPDDLLSTGEVRVERV
jgi:histone acetyltransferase (RNA polymerase elongator complex component)